MIKVIRLLIFYKYVLLLNITIIIVILLLDNFIFLVLQWKIMISILLLLQLEIKFLIVELWWVFLFCVSIFGGDLEGKVANSLYLCEMKLAKLLAGWLAPLRTVAFASRHEPCSTLELIAGFKSYKQLAADSQNRLCLQIPYPWYSSVAEKCSSPTILSFSTRTQVVDL